VDSLSDKDKRDIENMGYLALGDVSAVKKRMDILGMKATVSVMIQELKEEVNVKNINVSNPIGFVA